MKNWRHDPKFTRLTKPAQEAFERFWLTLPIWERVKLQWHGMMEYMLDFFIQGWKDAVTEVMRQDQ